MNKPRTFWGRLRKNVEIGPSCWNWKGYIQKGYGHLSIRGRSYRVHRFIYELLCGPIPKGLILDHLCRNRSCVNPDHLRIVTNKENVLAGIGPTAINKRKTHCPKGHEYSAENTHITPVGFRKCRICVIARAKREWQRTKRERGK